ncbi:phage tail tape measure protein [Streptomyces antimycoticus]|uniref:phage tail tape measure protein n=1 Tax=Streptomyces antimycoticus TaxID=68175 RepID=UPI000A369428|nr:phage tail tape measure protein [Streptomyces antimycoticus]
MALTIGELTGFITLDARGVDRGVSQAGQAMGRLRGQMTSDGDRAGQAAGQALGDGLIRASDGTLRDARSRFNTAGQQAGDGFGDGIIRGADGRLRDARGRFVTAGRQAGDGFGDGLTDGTRRGADDAEGEATGMMGRLKLAAAGAGAAVGGVLMAGIGQAMEQGQIAGRLGAQLGATPAVAKRYGHVAGQLYAKAVTEDFQGAADAIRATMSAGLLPPDATNAQIESIATKVSDLSTTFELDLGQAANAVGQIMKTKLAPNAQTALDIMTRGLQVMGPRADDLADTFNEYSVQFQQLGLDAQTATGLLSQGMKAGARDTDVVADALKEGTLLMTAMGDSSTDALKKMGLSASDIQSKIAGGGKGAREALQQVLDGLRKVKDPADRAAYATALFGTKAEDTQKALFALDPSKAADALGKVGGAADKMGNSLRDNAAVKMEQFKRAAQEKLVNFLGSTVIPGLMKFGGFVQQNISWIGPLAGVILGIAAAMAVWSAAQAVLNAVMAANPIVLVIGAILGLVAVIAIAWQKSEAFRAVVLSVWGVIKDAITGGVEGAKAAIGWFANLPVLVGGWFTKAKDWVVARWNSLINWLKGFPGKVRGALSSLGGILSSTMTSAGNRMVSAITSKITSAVNWVRGLPGRAKSALGSLGSTLYNAGRSLIGGFISGITSKAGELYGKAKGLVSKVRNLFPFSPAKEGPFAGKGYTLYSGRALMGDWALGITQEQGAVTAAMARVAQAGQDALNGSAPALAVGQGGTAALTAPRAGAPGTQAGGAATQQQTPVVRVIVDASGGGDDLTRWLRKTVRVQGRGNVQVAFGGG